MKILFIMPNTHYVRNFESVIVALADKGHSVILGLERGVDTVPPEVQSFVDALLLTHGGGIKIVALPKQQSFWSEAAAQLRAWRDYSRYFLPLHQRARRCADRAALALIPSLQMLDQVPSSWRERAARRIDGFCAWAEEVLPAQSAAIEGISANAPDIVLLTPLIDIGSSQVEYVKACRALRIPIVHCVASWDNLTNKGLIKALPDRVFVWNEAQKREAVELHDVPAERVVVTGAQLFDRWFEWRPSRDRQSFCAELGLDAAKPILLYTASSIFICRREVDLVVHWLTSIRSCGDPQLSAAGVIIRPHPKAAKTLAQWDSKELQALGRVVVFPRGGHMPLGEQARNDYYDSLYHCAAVIGINTSAMLEGAIVGRRSFTILLDEIREGQDGMVHFQHLTQSGFLGIAENLEEHVRQLAEELDQGSDQTTQFVNSFLRPYGLDQPATPRFVSEIEALEGLRVKGPSLVANCGLVQRPLLLPFVLLAALYGGPRVRPRRERGRAARRPAPRIAAMGSRMLERVRQAGKSAMRSLAWRGGATSEHVPSTADTDSPNSPKSLKREVA